jgi:Nidogen-like
MSLVFGRHDRLAGNSTVRLLVLLLACLCTFVCTADVASAEGNAIESLPGCTANTFPANDDGSVPNVPLGFSINFGGSIYDKTNLNNNGNITFQNTLSTYTPFDFTATGESIIAPYLADVDTRGEGSGVVTYGTGEEGSTKYFCVDWVNVGYYGEHTDKLNSFQLLLTQTPSEATGDNFTMTFNYDKIQWETGDASGGSEGFGGTPAAVGYSDGIEGGYVQTGSFTSGSFEDANTATGLIYQSLNAGGQPGRLVFNYSYEALTPPNDGTLEGEVVFHESTQAATGAPIEICPAEGGTCVLRTTNGTGHFRAALPPGTYNLTAYPPSGDYTAEGHKSGVQIQTKKTTGSQVVELGAGLTGPPEGTSVAAVSTNPDGIPVIDMNQPSRVTTIACAGAGLQYQITDSEGATIAGGPMHEISSTLEPIADSVDYEASYTPPASVHGSAHVKITGTCPIGATKVDVEFDIYIDPSGRVLNTSGVPVTNATVTLLRSNTARGPFIQIPNESAEMSAGNRVNPAVAPAAGVFGWDVVAGFYEIRATAPGCVSAANHAQTAATSGVLQVPPAADGLTLTLYCGPLTTPAPPVAVAANSSYVVQSIKTLANGSISVTILPTQAGHAALSGTVATARIASVAAVEARHKGKAKKCRRGTSKIHGKCQPTTTLYGSAAASGAANTPLTLTISPSGKIRAALSKGRTINVAAVLSYQSSLGGLPTTKALSVTVKGKKPKKKGKKHHKKH